MTERFLPRSPVPSSKPRHKLSCTMRIDRGAERWMYQHALRNHWRVSDWYDIDDLIQEGLICWHKVATVYRDTVNDRRHMMRLFQTTYRNRLHALANERTKRLSDEIGHPVSEQSYDAPVAAGEPPRQFSDHGEQAAEIELSGLLANAPEPVRRLFALVRSEDGPRRLRSLYRFYAEGHRETFNQRIAKLIGWSDGPYGAQLVGWDSSPDFYGLLKRYLGED